MPRTVSVWGTRALTRGEGTRCHHRGRQGHHLGQGEACGHCPWDARRCDARPSAYIHTHTHTQIDRITFATRHLQCVLVRLCVCVCVCVSTHREEVESFTAQVGLVLVR